MINQTSRKMIPIEKEPPELYKEFRKTYESCYFCKKNTDTWHEPTNKPVCETCAKAHDVSELKQVKNNEK